MKIVFHGDGLQTRAFALGARLNTIPRNEAAKVQAYIEEHFEQLTHGTDELKARILDEAERMINAATPQD